MQEQPKTPTFKGPAERFTGDVYVDMVVANPMPGSASVPSTSPRAPTRRGTRTPPVRCCTAPEGLGLVVTADEVIVLRPGMTVWTPPDQRHWHGAGS